MDSRSISSLVIILLMFIPVIEGVRLVTVPSTVVEDELASITCSDASTLAIINRNATTPVINCLLSRSNCDIATDPRLEEYRNNYVVSHNATSITITIANVSRSRDGGDWGCSSLPDTSVFTRLNIDVKVPVSTVTINNINSLIFIAGQPTSVTCQAGVSHPHASITWSIGGNNQAGGTTTNNTDGTTTSILQYTADKTDNNKPLQCSATNGYGTTKNGSIILNIRYPPAIHIEPSTSPNKVIQGRHLNLTCVVDEANPPVPSTGYTWSKNHVILPDESSSVYSVQSVERSNTGSFKCTVNNGVGTGISTTSVQVDVLFPPIVSTTGTSQYKVVELTDISLQCEATANPGDITYTWTDPGNVNSTGATLSISSISKDRSGVYTCTATNVMIPTSTSSPETGRGENTTTVDVLYGPTVTISPDLSIIELQENTPLQLTCTVQSNPPPTSFKWYKPDGTSQDVSTDGRLVIPSIKRNQTGLHRCEANTTLVPTNGVSISRSDSKTTNINVLYLDPVTISRRRLEVSEDEEVNIMCSTNSNPVASITWYNGSTATQSNTDTFIIDIATCLDTAVYSCHVTNTEIPDRQLKESASVFVKCSPRQDTRVDNQSIVSGNITDTVQLVADVIAYPAPSFTWYYTNTTTGGLIPISTDGSDQQMDVNTSINTFRSTLNINISSNIFSRSYTVNVTNDGGSKYLMFDVKAQTVPDPPSYITYSTHGVDNICVNWRAGFNGGDQQQFIVQHSTDDKSWTDSTTISTSNYCIENLQPDTLYYIRVVARNKYGDSQPVYLLEQGTVLPIRTMKEQTPLPTDFGLIGGIAGGAVALILIIIIAVIICRKRRNAIKETERIELTTEKAGETPTREDEMIVDINLDYQSADQLHGASGAAGDADGGTVNENSVDNSQKEPVYAEVDKSKNSKTNTKLTKVKTPTNQVYAQVDKSNKDQSKKNNFKPQKMPKPQTKVESKNKTPTREAYENVGIFGDFKGNPDELTTNKTNNTQQKAEKKRGEDLVYADLDFVAHKPSSGVLRKDEEGGVEYAGIDYTKRGPTPPPSSDSSDDD